MFWSLTTAYEITRHGGKFHILAENCEKIGSRAQRMSRMNPKQHPIRSLFSSVLSFGSVKLKLIGLIDPMSRLACDIEAVHPKWSDIWFSNYESVFTQHFQILKKRLFCTFQQQFWADSFSCTDRNTFMHRAVKK